MEYLDSHTHAQFAAYDDDRDELIKSTLKEEVGMINVGTNLNTSKSALDLAEKYSDDPIFATAGLHPTHTYSDYQDSEEMKDGSGKEKGFNYEAYKEIANKDKVVAIGECGLDYFRVNAKDKKQVEKLQKKALTKQIKLAEETDLPLMVHCRPKSGDGAYNELVDVINAEAGDLKTAVIHFFVGSKKAAKKFLDKGFYFTFGGVITFAREYDDVIDYIPLERILLETDAPYVTPAPHRGKRNEPKFVKEVYKKMSELKGVDIEDLKKTILENNNKVFDLNL